MATSSNAPVNRSPSKTPPANPLPRRGQVKENMGKQIVAVAAAAVATATALSCNNTGGGGGKKGGGGKPVPVVGAKKK
uniref:Uncharacterized protein n=1 Tax=Leersia perrieri TaxID=77586 RepID=A0A0D9V7I2_9ORYZ